MAGTGSDSTGGLGRHYVSLAVTFFNVLVLLAVIELGTRLFFEHITPIDINAQTLVTDRNQEPFFQSHPFAAFSWIPDARFGRQRVNSQGFVSTREIPFERVDNELRVVTLGGSSTVGNGNTDQNTYPRLLERLLQKAYPDRTVNVINAAAGGYSTIESLGYLQSRMLHWRPDVIVIMHGWNDMYYYVKSDEEISRWRENMNLQIMWDPKATMKNEDPLPADVQYLSWSQFYLHLRQWLREVSYTEEDPQQVLERRYDNVKRREDGTLVVEQQPINAAAEALYDTNMRQFASICETRGIRCLSILQPTLMSDQADPTDPKFQRATQTALLYHSFDFRQHIEAFKRIYAVNRAVHGEQGVVDATSLSRNSANFFDHIHLSAAGNGRLAELVARQILAGAGRQESVKPSNN